MFGAGRFYQWNMGQPTNLGSECKTFIYHSKSGNKDDQRFTFCMLIFKTILFLTQCNLTDRLKFPFD